MPILNRCSGPVIIYVSFDFPSLGNPPTKYFTLGTAEVSPTYNETVNYKALSNEVAGNLPLDETMEGYSMQLTMLLTVYNEQVLSAVRNRLHSPTSSLSGQYDAWKDIGSTIYGKKTIQLILQNSFFGTVNNNETDLAGYLFYFAKYNGSTPNLMGTSGNKIGIQFECCSGYVPLSSSLKEKRSGTFRCYDTPTSIRNLQIN